MKIRCCVCTHGQSTCLKTVHCLTLFRIKELWANLATQNQEIKLQVKSETLQLPDKWIYSLMAHWSQSKRIRERAAIWMCFCVFWNQIMTDFLQLLCRNRTAESSKSPHPPSTLLWNPISQSACLLPSQLHKGFHHFTWVDRQQNVLMQVMWRWHKDGDANWIVTRALLCHAVLSIHWLPSRPLITRMSRINLTVQ